jgi:aminoglycoside/choline kinase family phosphotransferase
VIGTDVDRRTNKTSDVRPRIDQFLSETGLAARGAKVVPLSGDAGDRRYFRVLLLNEPSQVLAVHPGPIAFESLPFVNVSALLGAMPLPVPRILGWSDALGIMALQDLGDVTLQAHLGAASPSEHAALYRQAVSFIDTLQRRGRDLASAEYVPFGIAFDVEKLTWELRFFVKHFLEAYRGATLSAAEHEALTSEFGAIAGELSAEPRVLCHRDYHSRNLMLHERSLHIIDFQDARLGPDTYDLASLLRDSYLDFTEPQVEELIAFYLALRGAVGDRAAVDVLDYRRRFDLMALQRNLKALGTFGFQTTSRSITVYIQYIPRTLNYVRSNLMRYSRFARLREILATHLDALR